MIALAMVGAVATGTSTKDQATAATALQPPKLAAPLEYRPLVPARLLETRPGLSTVDGVAQLARPVRAGQTIDVPVVGRAGVPLTGVSAVVLNVTATGPTASSFLTVWPTGASRPTSSNLNVVPGQTVPNLVIAKVGDAGRVSIFNPAGEIDIVADVAGYFPVTDGFEPLVPARLLDTRTDGITIDGAARPGQPLGTGGSLGLRVLGRGGVPASGVDAVVLNVTATNVSTPSFLTVWPSGAPRPTASNINMVAGATVPNLVVAKVGANGGVSIFNASGSTDVVADVAGYLPAGGSFVALSPARILETRPVGELAPGGLRRSLGLGPGETLNLPVTGVGGVPERGVSAVVLNVTAISPSGPSFVTVWPTGVSRPLASNLNLRGPDQVIANLVIAKVGIDGQVSIFNNDGGVNMVVDVAGYFVAEPGRVVDVVTSGRSGCALDAIGTFACWGEHEQDLRFGQDTSAMSINSFDDVVDVAVDAVSTCVLRSSGQVWCWGRNFYGQLGNGQSGVDEFSWPAAIEGLQGVVAIDAGYLRTCALIVDGRVTCWGSDAGTRPTFVPGLVGVVSMSIGSHVSCAVHTTGSVSCWGGRGLGEYGALGDGLGRDSVVPVTVADIGDATSVVVDVGRACAVRAGGDAACWGNSFLGHGTTGMSLTPVAVVDGFTGLPAADIVDVALGSDWLCAVRSSGDISCLGSSSAGQYGLSPSSFSSTTVLSTPVADVGPAVAIDGQQTGVCAITDASDVLCWGANTWGEVGDGSKVSRPAPTPVRWW